MSRLTASFLALAIAGPLAACSLSITSCDSTTSKLRHGDNGDAYCDPIVPPYPSPTFTRQPPVGGTTDIDPSPSTVPSPRPTVTRASRSRTGRAWTLDVTAYCWTGSRTASGVWPEIGQAATLDRSVPFGTRVEVPGYGVVVVTDRIGHGSDLDLYLGRDGCEARAERFGRRRLTVEVLP